MQGRFRGCLAGLALGDALGAPIEFESLEGIKSTYGPTGISDLSPWGRFPAGCFTDDTQMSLATARGMIRHSRSGGSVFRCVLDEYKAWRRTQTDPWECREPGSTCLEALGSGSFGTPEQPINRSKGCGGVMRVAPAGLAFEPGNAFDHASRFAALTHGHPTGHLTAGFLAEMISSIASGATLRQALKSARKPLRERQGHEETLEAVAEAESLATKPVPLVKAIGSLGEGWVAEEALAIAIFCALRFERDFTAGVTASVNHSGDSDSTGCITGALLGARLGIQALPPRWVERLERRIEILAIADELLQIRTGQPAAADGRRQPARRT
jgi:ADP-ribosylglycohydrolase